MKTISFKFELNCILNHHACWRSGGGCRGWTTLVHKGANLVNSWCVWLGKETSCKEKQRQLWYCAKEVLQKVKGHRLCYTVYMASVTSRDFGCGYEAVRIRVNLVVNIGET
jgi:hypothetical protein